MILRVRPSTLKRLLSVTTKPRLLIVGERGRPARFWNEIAQPLIEASESLKVITLFEGEAGLHKQLAELGVNSQALNLKSWRDYPAAVREIQRQIRDDDFNVVHGIEAIPAAAAGTAAKLARRPLLSVFHRQHIDFGGNRKLTAFSAAATRLNQVTLACSQACAEAAISDGAPAQRVRVAYNGANQMREVTPEELAATRNKLGIPGDALIVGAVSRLRSEKGLDTLIAATALAAQRVAQPVQLVIAGDGPIENELKSLAANVEIPVHFVGAVDDVALWFSLADVVGMPSHREALGVAAVEAAACSRPLVASAVGGLNEVVKSGETGLLVPAQATDQFADAITQLLSSAETRRRMGQAAKARFQSNFTNEAMLNGWLDCYRDFSDRWTPTA